ncbi:MAG: tetratricopeptide repeat protein [Candidatus Latescibacteria bacterium]|nr:tetratricopeptide repeat protein [Candidatus Latescibacterota bacterium]MDP7447555.1 tetratricopeptide repeat protein [Candidatus Latescibacterota bacterium]HJP31257.1 tetratricopeptide repeat protein [Candidatus Latescibacterota bacterium]
MEVTPPGASVIEVDSTNFEQIVLQGSKERVIVVDFWAEWCEPCKTLGPLLEDVVTALGPGIVLAKVDVDANQDLAQAFRVQSIPAVKVVKDGQLVDEFTGAVPREQLEERLRRHVPDAPPGATEEMADLVDAARVQLEMGDVESAERLYDEALREDAENGAALLGLARLRLMQDADEETIRELVGRIEEGSSEWEQGKALLTHLEFRGHCESAGGTQACAARLQGSPDDSEARYLVGCCAAVEGDFDTALREWFTIVETDRTFREGAAKDAMVSVFHLLGRQHPAVGEYPQRLYRTLY